MGWGAGIKGEILNEKNSRRTTDFYEGKRLREKLLLEMNIDRK